MMLAEARLKGFFNLTVLTAFCNVDFTKVDVHFSSGKANRFFYLLAEGTTNGFPSWTCNIGDWPKGSRFRYINWDWEGKSREDLV